MENTRAFAQVWWKQSVENAMYVSLSNTIYSFWQYAKIQLSRHRKL